MTNWKRLYTDASMMLAKYQDEVVPRLRKEIEELKKNQVKIRCKDCKNWSEETGFCEEHSQFFMAGMCWDIFNEDDFCSYGERKDNE